MIGLGPITGLTVGVTKIFEIKFTEKITAYIFHHTYLDKPHLIINFRILFYRNMDDIYSYWTRSVRV